MLGVVLLGQVIDPQAELQKEVHLQDRTQTKHAVVTAKRKGYWLEGVFQIASWEDVGETIGNEGEFKVTEPQQNGVDIEVDGVLLDPHKAHDLNQHNEGHHLMVTLPIGDHQLKHQQHQTQQDEDDTFCPQSQILAEDLVETLLEDGI